MKHARFIMLINLLLMLLILTIFRCWSFLGKFCYRDVEAIGTSNITFEAKVVFESTRACSHKH